MQKLFTYFAETKKKLLIVIAQIFIGVRAFLFPITHMVKTIHEVSFEIPRPGAIK